MNPFIGQIMMFGGGFAPRGWALCDGQLLSIPNHSALFSILGTRYGGDGRSTFGLPDLRGRAPIHAGHGPGLSNRTLGVKSGSETNTLLNANLPAIPLKVSSGNATQANPSAGTSIATPGSQIGRTFEATLGFNAATPDITLNGASVGGGSSSPVNNMPPFQVVNYIIALEGIYPSRN